MKDTHTKLVFILDASGSMQPLASDVIGGFNSFIKEQKTGTGTVDVSLVTFNSEINTVFENKDLQSVEDLTSKSFVPSGATALLDAIGGTVDKVGKQLADTPEAERPGKVVIVITTDGQENVSKTYTKERIAEMIKHQTEVYQWQFLFMAANQDAIMTASALNIPASRALSMANSGTATLEAYTSLSRGLTSVRSKGVPYSFTHEDRKTQTKLGAL
jgi:uncharacterized protein YegL